jgi:ADP-ribose pyrophosphatase YjhB (NUDIX family)
MSSTENQRGHHASIVVRDSYGRILLVQEEKQEHFGQWNLPGGRIEWREQPSDAAERELEEETGLSLEIRGPFAITASSRNRLVDFVRSRHLSRNRAVIVCG